MTKSPTFAVYGPSRGEGSWPRVTRGIAHGLAALGHLRGVIATDRLSHAYDDALSAGHDADVAIHVGPPAVGAVMRGRGCHRHRLALIAPNSSWLPDGVLHSLERGESVTGYVVPSTWAKEVLAHYTELPIHVYHHGVSPAYGPAEDRPDPGYQVLHMASTHRQRKGTGELIAAWCALVRAGTLPAEARLRLVVDGPGAHFADRIREAAAGSALAAGSILVSSRLDLDEGQMNAFYQWHHLVCQPSRAEGFGLVPLEARAAGVPVLVTRATGHRDHVGEMRSFLRHDGVVVVATGPDGPIDDGPGAMAPTVAVSDLAYKLKSAYEHRVELLADAERAAPEIRKTWSWAAVTERFVRQSAEVLS